MGEQQPGPPRARGRPPRPCWQALGSQCSGQTALALTTEQCASPISGPPEQDLPDQLAPMSLDHVPHRAQDAEEAEST